MDALLGRGTKSISISRENAVPEFKQALGAAREISEIEDAVRQMGGIVRALITDSFADSLYNRALENIGTMRSQLIDFEEPGLYDAFVRDLKTRLLSGELGGDRRDIWLKVRLGRLGLIDKTQSEVSNVTKEEADEVCSPVGNEPLNNMLVANRFAVLQVTVVHTTGRMGLLSKKDVYLQVLPLARASRIRL